MTKCRYCGAELHDGYYREDNGDWYCDYQCAAGDLDKSLVEDLIESDVMFYTTSDD